MRGEANCIICSRARALIALVPVARGYALKVYECACCHSTLHLVTRVTKADLIKQRCGTPLPAGKWFDATTADIGDRRVHQRVAN